MRRRLLRLAAGIAGLMLLVPLLSAARAVLAYRGGTAELWYSGYPSRGGLDLDPSTRVPWVSRGCLVPFLEPLLVELPNNTTVSLLAAAFGPMRGTYHGPYPTAEEAAAILADGMEVGPVPERSEWPEGLDCEALRSLVQADPVLEGPAGRCALYREQTLVLGAGREAHLIERRTGRRYAVHFLPAGAQPEAERWLGEFAAYPRARLVCRQHVVGAGPQGPHIEWMLYATPDPPARVVAFYAAERGIRARSGQTKLTLADARERKKLSVHPVGDSYPDCGVRPGPEASTVLVVSQWIEAP